MDKDLPAILNKMENELSRTRNSLRKQMMIDYVLEHYDTEGSMDNKTDACLLEMMKQKQNNDVTYKKKDTLEFPGPGLAYQVCKKNAEKIYSALMGFGVTVDPLKLLKGENERYVMNGDFYDAQGLLRK